MTENELFDGMAEMNDISIQQILNNLLNAENNLNLKTQVDKSKQLTFFPILSKYLKKNNFENSGKILESFINIFSEYMTSYKNEGG